MQVVFHFLGVKGEAAAACEGAEARRGAVGEEGGSQGQRRRDGDVQDPAAPRQRGHGKGAVRIRVDPRPAEKREHDIGLALLVVDAPGAHGVARGHEIHATAPIRGAVLQLRHVRLPLAAVAQGFWVGWDQGAAGEAAGLGIVGGRVAVQRREVEAGRGRGDRRSALRHDTWGRGERERQRVTSAAAEGVKSEVKSCFFRLRPQAFGRPTQKYHALSTTRQTIRWEVPSPSAPFPCPPPDLATAGDGASPLRPV